MSEDYHGLNKYHLLWFGVKGTQLSPEGTTNYKIKKKFQLVEVV
jgi:hypothetical protein